jgi:hypothetical protein
MPLARRAIDSWFRPIDPIRLDLFTRGFALTLLVYLGYRFLHPYEWLTSAGFHSAFFHQQLFGRGLPLLMPVWAVPFFGVLICGCVLAVIVGWRSQLMCRLLVPQLIYIQLGDSYSASTMNKLYIAVLVLLAVAPEPHRIGGQWRQSAWPQRTLQLTLMVFYFNAGIAKALHGD